MPSGDVDGREDDIPGLHIREHSTAGDVGIRVEECVRGSEEHGEAQRVGGRYHRAESLPTSVLMST
jgi:hypothetical protein